MAILWEFRWHGRGGQGIVTAARLFAEAAHQYSGFAGATAAPSFGAERRGAAVSASTRLSDQPVTLRSQVYKADLLVLFDPTLLPDLPWASFLKPGAIVVVNAKCPEAAKDYFGPIRRLVQVDASQIALEEGMVSAGSPLVGSAVLGALSKAFPDVKLASIEQCLKSRFAGNSQCRNLAMARKGFEKSQILEFT